MILPALALGMQLVMPIAAAGRVPQLDVEPVCKGIAEQGGLTFRDPRVELAKKNCIESEQTIREQVVKHWSSFSADDRRHCVSETTMGGLSSYTELLTCLEMARDVRMETTGLRSRLCLKASYSVRPNIRTLPSLRPRDCVSRNWGVDAGRPGTNAAPLQPYNLLQPEGMARRAIGN
jgi:hypothetical protein